MRYERCIQDIDVHPIIKKLVEARLAWDLTTEAIASRAGCSINHFRHLENGSNVPGFKLLNSWASALGYEVALKSGELIR